MKPRMDFDGVKISVRAWNVLQNLGVKNVRELLEFSDAELLAQPNFGRKSLRELKDVLGIEGMTLKKKPKILRPIETAEGKRLFQDYQIAKLKWEIYRDKHKLRYSKG